MRFLCHRVDKTSLHNFLNGCLVDCLVRVTCDVRVNFGAEKHYRCLDVVGFRHGVSPPSVCRDVHNLYFIVYYFVVCYIFVYYIFVYF